MLIRMCLSPDVIGCRTGGPRIREDKEQPSSTFKAAGLGDAACHVGSWNERCYIEALVYCTGTGPEFCLGVIVHRLAVILCYTH